MVYDTMPRTKYVIPLFLWMFRCMDDRYIK